MVERVNQAQSLIEEHLRACVLGRNWMMQVAEARHHRDRLRAPDGVMLSGSKDCDTKTNRATQQSTRKRQQCHTDLLKCSDCTKQL